MDRNVTFALAQLPNLPMEDFIRLTVLAEKYLDGFWVRDENPSHPFRDAYIAMALMAINTRKIFIGSSITSPYARHPTLVAEATLTLDELSNGRAALGLGLGGSLSLSPMQIKMWDRPMTALREAVEIVRLLYVGGTVNYDGKVFKAHGVKMFRTPTAKIPIHIGGRGPMMIRLGGEIADGVQTITPLAYMEFIKEQIAIGAKKGGRDPSEIELQSAGSLAIDRDRNEAINLAKYNLTWVIPDSPDILLEKIGVKREEANHIAEVREKEGREVAMQLVTDKMVDAIAVAGNPEEIIKKLVAKVRAGVSSLVFASPMGKDKFEALRILGEEVIPAVRSEL